MRRLAIGIVVLMLLMVVPTALAWDRAVGCTVDAYGDPWTWGGTVVCRQDVTGIIVGTPSPAYLDANGCFDVFIGNGLRVNCTINYTPGPNGDPANDVCQIPTDSTYLPYPWDCGLIDTGTGPTAVSLSGFGAAAMPAGTAALGLAALAGLAAAWKRRR